MVPAFLARHPPPPPHTSTSSTTPYYSYEGPALAPATTVKPVPETSKDFFHNMRDLQNSMADFSVLHDAAVLVVSPATNFSDEALSSTLFLLFTVVAAFLFIFAHLVPWRFIFLIAGNAAMLAKHPRADSIIQIFRSQPGEANGHDAKGKTSSEGFEIFGFVLPSTPSGLMALVESAAAISLDSYPEEREVEIFELQHRTYSPFSGLSEWEPFLFTAIPYDPLSPSRISGDRPRGTRFFEDVKPPRGWVWKAKKWELDLESREWVMERMVTGVEFEVPGSNGDGIGEEVGGWVWDLPFHPPEAGLHNDNAAASEGPLGITQSEVQAENDNAQIPTSPPRAEWEEATEHSDRTGEWRRRRWVRVVRRVTLDEKVSQTG